MSRDKKALQILIDTYWSPKGWKKDRTINSADFAYARQAGYMFDPVTMTHDDIVARLLIIRSRVSIEQVTDAFLASLSARRLELRSALGSFSFAAHFPDHRLVEQAGRQSVSSLWPLRPFCRKAGRPKRPEFREMEMGRRSSSRSAILLVRPNAIRKNKSGRANAGGLFDPRPNCRNCVWFASERKAERAGEAHQQDDQVEQFGAARTHRNSRILRDSQTGGPLWLFASLYVN
jgi:hypothetical protein